METFDRSTLDQEGNQILIDFKTRRKIFDDFIAQEKLNLFTCPSCGYPSLSERGIYDICEICNWEDDRQDDARADEVWGGPNQKLSLTASRLIFGAVLSDKLAHGKKLITDPAKVLKVIQEHFGANEEFITQHITGETRTDDPVWPLYEQQKESIIDLLIE